MTVRVALIGCGFFARNHMHAWRGLPGAEVVAVCDLDPAKAGSFAAEFGASPFTDAAAMLADVRPDVADIATTVPSHRPLVELAARHAGAVICQKPFAGTLDDGRAMVAACATAGVPLFVHENFRWQKPWREIAARLRTGEIGRPRFLRLSFRHGYDIYANQPYLAEEPDLALTDVGLHLFDMARSLMGDVERVSCETQRLNPRVTGQDAFQAILRHARVRSRASNAASTAGSRPIRSLRRSVASKARTARSSFSPTTDCATTGRAEPSNTMPNLRSHPGARGPGT
jgi:predicted dehydrogenase